VRRGRAPETLRSLADLVALDAFKDGLRFFVERRGGTSSSAIEDMATALKAVAKHYVKLDAAALEAMTAIIRRVSVKKRGMTPKNRERLRAFEDREKILALLRLPARLMREAAASRLPPRRAALLAQTAVAIEILIMAPLRLGNLVALDLDRHLVRLGRARDQLHIVFAEAEVKNDIALDHPLPGESAALIAQDVETYLPVLAGPGNRALFPGVSGGSKSMNTLRGQIIATVFRYVGVRVHPHLFRHLAGKVHLDAHPGEHGVVSRLLAHKSMETVLSYYSGMETAAAVRHFTSQRCRHSPAKPPPSLTTTL
jgi:integrase